MPDIERAVILANEAYSSKVLLGLPLLQRALKTARREGAKQILLIAREKLVDDPDVTIAHPTDKGALGAWFRQPGKVLVLSDNVVLANRETGWMMGDGVFAILEGEEIREGLEQGSPLDRLVGGRAKLPKMTLKEIERAMLKSMIKPTDGFFARYFDRRISLFFSRFLVRTPVTPNLITFFTMVIGLGGAALVWLGTYGSGVAGAAAFVFSTIIDGCDGEVARLKFLQSKFGFVFDTVADNVVYLSVMVAIAATAMRTNPETDYYLLFGLLAAGMAITTLIIFTLMRRSAGSRARLFLERLANGDFSYLVLGFAVAGHLEWFLWAAAFGVHGFYLVLLAILLRGRRP